MRLATAQQMRNLDSIAINDFGIPGIVLMENAGRATVEAMEERWEELAGQRVAIFVGPGNNGGDGLVIARHLHQRHVRPQVYLVTEPGRLQGDAAVNLLIVEHLGIPIREVWHDEALANVAVELEDCFLVVDAMFGTGLKREVLGIAGEVVELINRGARRVVAVDVPSGLNVDNGAVLGRCVRADLTVTFGLAKPGLCLPPGRELVGELVVADIGIPPEVVEQGEVGIELLTGNTVGPWIPRRPATSHKGDYGHLLVLGGSPGKTGAALLAARGALRSGVGLVTLGAPPELNAIYQTALPEAMTHPLADSTAGRLSVRSLPGIRQVLQDKRALVIGPGLGQDSETVDLVATLYREVTQPMVVDADALNILAGHPAMIGQAEGPRILTPHPGEMARLTGRSSKAVQADRLEIAARFARDYSVLLVLKGAATVIAHPDGRLAINSTGNPGMATGGMGDVLAGLIGGFLAQGLGIWEAACLGVFVHGAAGDRPVGGHGGRCGFLATEVADAVPAVLTELALNS